MTKDPSFFPTADDLALAVDLMADAGVDRMNLPTSLPEDGVGDRQSLVQLAPLILGGARVLGDATAFAHMDPPTPWVTWATTLWNASLNQNLLHPDVAPAAIGIEEQVIEWLAPVFGMTGGHMTAGSTLANLTALWAARDVQGVEKVYASSAAHLSIGKAAHILGMEFYALPPDDQGRLTRDALPLDLSDGALVLTAGATSTGAIDDLSLTDHAAWTHVDAAWAGPMKLSDKYAARLAGIEGADSVAMSAHKWMFQPKESGMVLFRDVETSHRAVSFGGAYLAQPNVGVLGSRAAVAAPLLATLLAWGRSGLAARIDQAMSLADDLHAGLSQMQNITLFGPNTTGVILWRDVEGRAVDHLLTLLPPGMASKTSVAGQEWVRQVAANPNADIQAILADIRAALARKT